MDIKPVSASRTALVSLVPLLATAALLVCRAYLSTVAISTLGIWTVNGLTSLESLLVDMLCGRMSIPIVMLLKVTTKTTSSNVPSTTMGSGIEYRTVPFLVSKTLFLLSLLIHIFISLSICLIMDWSLSLSLSSVSLTLSFSLLSSSPYLFTCIVCYIHYMS